MGVEGKIRSARKAPAHTVVLGFALCLSTAPALASASEAAGAGDQGAASHFASLVTAQEDLFLQVFINDYDTKKLAAFHRFADGCMTIAPEDLKEFNLKIPDAAMHESGGLCLEKMPGLTYRYEVESQTIHLKATDDARVTLDFDARRARPAPSTAQELSAVFNYALFASASSDDIASHSYPHYQGVSANLDGHIFSRYGGFDQSLTANTTASELTPHFVRLDTRWFYENPDTLVTYAAGDVISGSLNWTTSLRMGGFQIRRDFALRPDLITQPLPQFSGSAAVPSTVEVFANQTRAFTQEIAGGPFTINNIPVASGPGTMRIVLHDATGKETATEYATYNATTLLAPGLVDYSIEGGFARQFYGFSSDGYDRNPIGSASLRYGLTPRITLEGHAEGGAGLLNAGAGVDFGLWNYGAVSLAASGSSYGSASGGQVYGSFETSVWGARLMMRALQSLGDYDDLASVTAPRCDDLRANCWQGKAYKRQEQVSLSVPLFFDESFVNVGYADSLGYDGEASKVGTLSYTRPFLWNSTISFNVFNDFERKDNYGAYASVTYSWGKNTASAIAESANGESGVGASFTRGLSQEAGSYGYSVTALEGSQPRNAVSAAYRASAFEASAAMTETGKSANYTANLNGAVALLNGVHFANRIDNSFAVVDTGIPNTRVLYENNPIGETGSDGTFLIPSMRARQENAIAIDPESLPVQADMPDMKQVVTPGMRGGLTVRFKGSAAPANALVSFKDEKGDWLTFGSEAFVNGSETAFAVGYDGESYLSGLSPTNSVLIKKPDGSRCAASFEFVSDETSLVRIDGVVCTSLKEAVPSGGVTIKDKQ